MQVRSPHTGSAPLHRHALLGRLLLVLAAITFALSACSSPGRSAAPAAPAGSGDDALAAPLATISVVPGDRAINVSPIAPVGVTVADGWLTDVMMTNPEGAPVAGMTAPDGLRWNSTEPLGYGKTYTINATATGTDGKPVTTVSSFSTLQPEVLTYPSMNPLDGDVVGVGQPIAVIFDAPIADKQAAEDAIRVTTEPAVVGAFYWFSDKEVHWRPEQYWAPGTRVTLDLAVYGKDFGNGVYGQEDRRATFTIGDSVIARADGASHQMTVEVNGQLVRTMPASLGNAKFPSHNGIHVVSQRHSSYTMDSRSYGLSFDEGGYVTTVRYATRISNGGEFVHAAPWSVGDQGERNVSHGCINLSTENAKWFYDTAKKGDVVIISNSGGPELKPWDGFGDWQIPWSEWLTGGERR